MRPWKKKASLIISALLLGVGIYGYKVRLENRKREERLRRARELVDLAEQSLRLLIALYNLMRKGGTGAAIAGAVLSH